MEIITIAIWILLGAVSGWLASEIMESGLDTIGNIILGTLGSFLGGWLGSMFGVTAAVTGGLTIASIFTAIIGSCILVFIFGLLKKA